ncbi:MAG: hypothetical protein ACFHVJ_10590 [Aestuariibacter sp.]
METSFGMSGQHSTLEQSGRIVKFQFHEAASAADVREQFQYLKTHLTKAEHLAYVLLIENCSNDAELQVLKQTLPDYLYFLDAIGVRNIVTCCANATPEYLAFLKDCETNHIKTHFFFDEIFLENWLSTEFKNDIKENVLAA